MNNRVLCLTGAILLCAAWTGAFAQKSNELADTKARLVAMERLWDQAQLNRDAKAIATMIGDRFIDTEPDGAVSNRSKFLAEVADPRFQPSLMSAQNDERPER